MRLPLEHVRVTAMEQLIAIPHATKMLADMGAQIIRIESNSRLDTYRSSSFYENTATGEYWNRAANFHEQNRNKLGLTRNLPNKQGLDTLKNLIAISDVFVENFTPRVMRNFGLEYADVKGIKPDIIMVSSTGYGYTGPWSNFGAIGYTTEAASGLSHMSGYKDGPPVLAEIPYADYTAAEHTVFAIMAALIYRSGSGKGQFIDVSQSETVSSTIPEALLDYTVNGRIRERMGNHDPVSAPHGCYPCRGHDKWIAIAVSTDTQWLALCDVIGDRIWDKDKRFHDSTSRWKHRNDLDLLMAASTTDWDQCDLMHVLQEKNVPAGAVLNGKQLLFNRHLKHRQFYEMVHHHPRTSMPPLPYSTRPWKMSETAGRIRMPAPTLGEHNSLILSELLGNHQAVLTYLEKEGVIGHEPVGHKPPSILSLDDLKYQGQILNYHEDFKDRIQREYGT